MVDNQEINEFVNKVREHSDIFSVVSRYVTLKKKGSQYWGCCPFHNEKTPSFTISPEKGFFYCFGCHVGGNIFKFISLIENISYFEAVKLQAERIGIELPQFNKKKTPAQQAIESKQKLLIKINTITKDFFHNCLLLTSYGELGRKYLESRGINKETIEEFNLGFAPDRWDALSNALIKKKDFKPEQLLEAGLSLQRKNGSGIYDKFRNRVMIPIADLYGNIVAFGGRILPESYIKNSITNISNYEAPKYLNSPETLVFNKRNLLFGLNKATQEIRKLGFVIVVEGYMDVISVFSAGVKNVVASLGTAFTEEQAKLLTRYTRKIYFCYDSDDAGQNATIRALPIVLNTGAEVKVIIIPDGKDPDEYIRNHGVEEFKKLLSEAISIVDYRIEYILKHNDYSSLEGKLNALNQILPVLNLIKEQARQTEYCKNIARKLLMNEDVVISELGKWKNRSDNFRGSNITDNTSAKTPIINKEENAEDNNKLSAGRNILRMVWLENDTLMHLNSILPKEALAVVHQEILEYLQKCLNEGKSPNDISAMEELSEPATSEISKILIENENNADKRDNNKEITQAYVESVNILKLRWLRLCYAKIIAEIKKLSTDVNYKTNPDYIKKIDQSFEIKKEMDKLKKEMDKLKLVSVNT